MWYYSQGKGNYWLLEEPIKKHKTNDLGMETRIQCDAYGMADTRCRYRWSRSTLLSDIQRPRIFTW